MKFPRLTLSRLRGNLRKLYNREKSDSPTNANQIYVDGKRYRSISSAAADTEITFCHIVNKLTESNGGPIVIKGHHLVSERWLLFHPDEILKIVEKAKK